MEERSVRSERKEEWSAGWCGKTVRERSGRIDVEKRGQGSCEKVS